MEITSRNNDKIKHFVKLTSSAKQRKMESLFTLEGIRLCADAEKSGYEILELYVTEDAKLKYADRLTALQNSGAEPYVITKEVAEKLSDTVHPQGVFCVAKMKVQSHTGLQSNRKYIALQNIQTPDNLGAIARTAEALGVNGLLVAEGCDIYNAKAQRSAMGSLLRLPILETNDLEDILREAAEKQIPTFATVPDSTAQKITDTDFSKGALVIIGNEGNGVTENVQKAVDARITIPMLGNAESLNAAAAAVITMWEMMR